MPPKTDEKQVMEQMRRMVSIFNPNTLTTEQFKSNFKRVLDFTVKFKKRILEEIAALKKSVSDLSEELKEKNTIDIDDLRTEIRKVASESQKEQADGLNFMRDKAVRIKDFKDGKDADEKKIIKRILKQIILPEQKELLLDNPVQLAEKLELLEDENRLDIKAIRGLAEIIEELRQRPVGATGAGVGKLALEAHTIDDEDLTTLTTPNASETDFPLVNTPNPASSVKVFRNGQRQRLTEDYTFSNRTITFVIAPASDEILVADYRT